MSNQNIPSKPLLEKYQSQIYRQNYNDGKNIEGVQIIELKNFLADEGDFSEIIHLDSNGAISEVSGFKPAQINRTHLFPRSIKAWHIHKIQNEIWYVVPNSQLTVGLLDLREGSKTAETSMRLVLGGGKSQLLYIPSGVAHGSVNFSKRAAELFYFVDQTFNPENPDEYRLHWDLLGENFWQPERD